MQESILPSVVDQAFDPLSAVEREIARDIYIKNLDLNSIQYE